jgi:hypothetical protein
MDGCFGVFESESILVDIEFAFYLYGGSGVCCWKEDILVRLHKVGQKKFTYF